MCLLCICEAECRVCVSVGCVSVRVGMWACEYTCICVRVVNEEVLNVGQGHYGQRVTPAANMAGVGWWRTETEVPKLKWHLR